MIKVVLFDADGVLINGTRFSLTLSHNYGISIDKTAPFFNGPFRDCILGKSDLKQLLPKYLKQWGWRGPVDDFIQLWFRSEHQIDQQLIEYVGKLRKQGTLCILATNQEKYRIQYMLNQMGFAKSFDKVYASCHLGHKKPDYKFYENITRDLVIIQKDEILFWDDSENNIKAAQEFGINGEVYTSFEDFKQKMKAKYLFTI